MKKLPGFEGKSPKLIGSGFIDYCLWINEDGNFYVQMLKTDCNSTFSKYLFSVSTYVEEAQKKAEIENISGFDPNSFNQVNSRNTNDARFLKAVLLDLIKAN